MNLLNFIELEAAKPDGKDAFHFMRHWIHPKQLRFTKELSRGEEGQFFIQKMIELTDLIQNKMPKVYAQDGLGEQAIVYLHYFGGNLDWFILEKDTTEEQHQAFGYANFGHGAELGYISIQEIITQPHLIELDYHFTPRTVAETRKQYATQLASMY